MNLADAVFLLGPIGAMVLVPVVVVVICLLRRPLWAVWLAISLTVGIGLVWLSYWVLWGKAFGYADAYEPVPARLDAALKVTMGLCAGGVVALVATAVAATALSLRTCVRAVPT